VACRSWISYACEKGGGKLQIFGDSMLIVNCVNGVQQCRNIYLDNIVIDIIRLCIDFAHFSCKHIYRERNMEAYKLFKEGLLLDRGLWQVTKFHGPNHFEFYHRPFIDNGLLLD